MARASKRLEVLEAIVSIIERDGLTAVTLDAVALETGMTRAGLLYHFPSREALILATHEHLTRSWEQELEASAGNTSDRATDAERHCCKVSDEAAFCLIQRPYISKTLLTRRISPR
ncbi:TetR/AcrR family transcriptional regulator, partial [Enterobacter cloacae]